MKDIFKNIKKIILFGEILIIIMEVLSFFLIPEKDNLYQFGMSNFTTYEILTEKENTVDVVAIGDSLVYSAISPMEIWHNYGYTTFDCAKASQMITESYDNLKIAIKSQHPKVVVFEADVLFRNPLNRPWYYDYKQRFNQYVPIIKYHNYWKKYMFNSLNDYTVTFSKINVYKGFKYVNTIDSAGKKDYMKPTKTGQKIPENNLKEFKKMVELCNENNVKLVIISIPNLKKWNYSKHLSIEKLANEYNLEFIDLNIDNPLNIDWVNETRDKGGHLNYKGALKVSKYLGEYLKQTGLVADHRNDKNYDSWNESYKLYKENL